MNVCELCGTESDALVASILFSMRDAIAFDLQWDHPGYRWMACPDCSSSVAGRTLTRGEMSRIAVGRCERP